jgi:HTH-type transcriptional regulator, glycine betaine synthesis regulator
MLETLQATRQTFIENLSGISEFWGYPRAMGALYGALYLSPTPLSLDDLIPIVGVTKGAISTNVRALEQLGMVHKHVRSGDRKDYYQADIDFWKIAKTILERRQKPEFDKALKEVSSTLQRVRLRSYSGTEAELAKFYEERLSAMESFFHTVDGVVAMVLQVERLRVEGLRAFLRIPSKPNPKR